MSMMVSDTIRVRTPNHKFIYNFNFAGYCVLCVLIIIGGMQAPRKHHSMCRCTIGAHVGAAVHRPDPAGCGAAAGRPPCTS